MKNPRVPLAEVRLFVRRCLAALSAISMLATSGFAQLYSNDFDSFASPVTNTASGTANGFVIQYNAAAGAENFTAIFGFDYSTVTAPSSIPTAPSTVNGTTKGLLLTVNKNPALPGGAATGGNAAAVNLYPSGQSFSGNFALKFDMWISWTNLNTSSEHTLFGINHSGGVANRIGKTGSDGVFFAVTGDGGSASGSTTTRDFSVFLGAGAAAPTLKTTGFGPTAPLATTFDNAAAGFTTLFPAKPVTGYPNTPAGTPGLGWVRGEVRQTGNLITWLLNDTIVAQFTNTTAYTSGNILLGYSDAFGGSIGDLLNYVIFDNLRVDDLGPSLSVTAPTPSANESGPASGVFTVTRLGNLTGPLTVTYTMNGSALQGVDYTNDPPAFSVTFAPGAASTNITLTPLIDTETEFTETAILALDPGVGYILALPSSNTVSILDAATPEISINGDIAGAQTNLLENFVDSKAILRVTRKGSLASATTVGLTYGGSAGNGTDYNAPASVTFAPGAATTNLILTPISDSLVEAPETITVTVNNGGYDLGASTVAGVTVISEDIDTTGATPVFRDGFDTDTSLKWQVNKSPDGDSDAVFSFDYSPVALSIPEAPHTPAGAPAQRGLRLRAHLLTGLSTNAISVSPIGVSVAGDFRLRFDLWMNYIGPLNVGGAGSTEHFSAGVGTDGARVVWPHNVNSDGIWFTGASDGGVTDTVTTQADSGAFVGPILQPAISGYYPAGTDAGARGNGNIYYAPFGGSVAAPGQTNAYPTQSSQVSSGAYGMAWHYVNITKQGNNVSWDMDGYRIANIPYNNAASFSTNVFLGFFDWFTSACGNTTIEFGLFDNVIVEVFPTVITSVVFINGGTDVQITFTGSTTDADNYFALESSSTAETGYTNTGATPTTLAPGEFQVTVPRIDNQKFYRIKRL